MKIEAKVRKLCILFFRFNFLVVTALISNGDEETAEGKLRWNALNALCDMNPGQALSTRTLCVELGKMPSLMLKLSLKDPMDLVSLIDMVFEYSFYFQF